MTSSLARPLALFLGGFTLLNLLGEMRFHAFEPNVWWIDLRAIPLWLSWPVLIVTASLWIAFGTGRSLSTTSQRVAVVGTVSLLLVTFMNAATFWLLLLSGSVTTGMPLPFSMAMSALLAVIAIGLQAPQSAENTKPQWRRRSLQWATFALGAIAFPLGLMFCFGKTDYRRPADAIVVFGCRVYEDGEPSLSLADRVRTGCELYRAGLAPRVVFSGGPGDGATHETEAMKQLALKLGVPAEAISLDPDGLNTWATVRNTSPLFAQSSVRRVLAVSHFYHLPRVKLAYQRSGWDVFTVPADETRRLSQMPFLIAREVAAFWAYYLRAIVS